MKNEWIKRCSMAAALGNAQFMPITVGRPNTTCSIWFRRRMSLRPIKWQKSTILVPLLPLPSLYLEKFAVFRWWRSSSDDSTLLTKREASTQQHIKAFNTKSFFTAMSLIFGFSPHIVKNNKQLMPLSSFRRICCCRPGSGSGVEKIPYMLHSFTPFPSPMKKCNFLLRNVCNSVKHTEWK